MWVVQTSIKLDTIPSEWKYIVRDTKVSKILKEQRQWTFRWFRKEIILLLKKGFIRKFILITSCQCTAKKNWS